MSIEPQYTFDNMGNPIGVSLPMEDWNKISEELHMDIPGWQKTLIDQRLSEYNNKPDDTLDCDTVRKELAKEDEAL